MAKIRHNLVSSTHAAPTVAPVTGGRSAVSSPVRTILRSQDSQLVNGRRIIAAQSLDQEEFSFPEDETPDILEGDGQSHHFNVDRLVYRGQCHVTPGHMLRLSVLTLPSGETQGGPHSVGEASFYLSDGRQGILRTVVTWTDRVGLTESNTYQLAVQPSPLEYGALPTTDGGLWGALQVGSINLIAPPDIETTDELARWSIHTAVTIEIYHYGGLRVVDAVLHEQPYGIALDTEGDAEYRVSGINADGMPNGTMLGFTHPLQRYNESPVDPRAGAWTMLEAAEAQSNRLGPLLLSWTPWNEAVATIGSTDLPSRSTTSTSFVGLVDESLTAYSTSSPGWSVSSGAYARRWWENHPLAMSARDGSIPVRVWVYADSSTSAGGIVRVQTAPYSWIDVTITDTEGWHKAYGHLRVGKGPGDPVTAQAFMRKLTSGTLYVYGLMVEYAGDWESAV